MRQHIARLVAALVTFGTLTWAPQPPGEVKPAVAVPNASGVTEKTALAQARATGSPVEVTTLTTPTTHVVARPDGTLTAQVATQPVRFKRGDTWVPIDPRLTRDPGGYLAPAASPADVRFSPGGDGPFVTMVHEDRRIELSWPGRLPAPRLTGAEAVYAGVLPGVDLVAEATASGFRQKLVVHNPQAATNPALARVRYGLRTENWDLRQERLAAFMWDSSAMPHRHPMRVEVDAGSLTVVPDPAVLADPGLVYPLHLDPEVTANRAHWTMVWSTLAGQSYYDTTYSAFVGHDPDDEGGGYYRSYFEIDSAFLIGKQVVSAKFQAVQTYAYNCNIAAVHLWHTGPITSATTWSNQPAKLAEIGQAVTDQLAGGSGGCAGLLAEWQATSFVADVAAQARRTVTVALMTDERGSDAKKFQNEINRPDGQKVPTFSIVYNTVPGAPAVVATGSMPGCAGAPAMWVTTQTPELTVRVPDPDVNGTGTPDAHGIDFEIRRAGEPEAFHRPPRTFPGTYTYTVVGGVLDDGGRYEWRARATDSYHTGPYGPWCPFAVDVTGPSTRATVTSAHFIRIRPAQPVQYGIRVDELGYFTLSGEGDPDVAGFAYHITPPFASPVSGRVAAAAPGGTATLPYRPQTGGISAHDIKVWTLDRAGNSGPGLASLYTFRVKELPAVVSLSFADWDGQTALDSAPGGPNGSAVFTGEASPVEGRHGQAVHLTGAAQTWGLTGEPVFDPTRSYTLTAWARLTAENDWFNVLSTDGHGLELRYLPGDDGGKRWEVLIRSGRQDSDPQVLVRSDTLAQVGAWTHLAVVHDRDRAKIILYVNGRKSGEAAHPTPWANAGRLRIGALACLSGPCRLWRGDIDDVSVFDLALSAEKIKNDVGTSDPLAGSGNWRLDESEGLTIEDSSGNGHHAVRYGATSWTQGRHAGALQLGGGWAHTDRPVIEPNASYTIAAWVRLDQQPLQQEFFALSQDGRWDSRFRLGAAQFWDGSDGWVFSATATDTPDSSGSTVTVVSDTDEQIGIWTHLAGVYDHQAGQLRLYVNGRLAGTAAFTNPQPAAGSLVFGRWQANAGTSGKSWPGLLDHVRVEQRALAVDEIAAWMDWPGKWGPNAYWPFGENTGIVAADSTGNDHSLNLLSGAVWTTGRFGTGLRLGGQISGTFEGGRAETGQPVVASGASFTVAGWGRLDNLDSSATLASQDGTHDSGFALMYDKSRGCWSFRIAKLDSLTSDDYAAACAGTPQAQQWTHLAGTYDHVNGVARLYVNGAAVASVNHRMTWFPRREFLVGRQLGGGNGWPMHFWKGEVDDVRVLGEPATAAKIAEIMPMPKTFTNGTDFSIGDNTTIESPITVSGVAGTASPTAHVTVAISHQYIGDLVVTLVAPDGSTYILHNRTGSSADDIAATYTVNLSAETANGTWKLRVSDQSVGDAGTLTSWSFTPDAFIAAPPPPPPPPEVHVSASCQDTATVMGWQVYLSGLIVNAPSSIRNVSASWSTNGTNPFVGASATGSTTLSVSSSSFSGHIPPLAGAEWFGGYGVNWTVTVTLNTGATYSRTGYTSMCAA